MLKPEFLLSFGLTVQLLKERVEYDYEQRGIRYHKLSDNSVERAELISLWAFEFEMKHPKEFWEEGEKLYDEVLDTFYGNKMCRKVDYEDLEEKFNQLYEKHEEQERNRSESGETDAPRET